MLRRENQSRRQLKTEENKEKGVTESKGDRDMNKGKMDRQTYSWCPMPSSGR